MRWPRPIWVRRLGWTTGGALAALVLLFGFLQTAVGLRTLAGLASDDRLEIEGLAGFFPGDLRADRIELRDKNGAWLVIQNAHLDWSPSALLRRRLLINALTAERIDMLRPPEPDSGKAAESEGGFSRPDLAIDLRALAIADLHLAAAVGGVDSRWRGSGQGVLARRLADSRLSLLLERTDGADGRASAAIRFDPESSEWIGEVLFEERTDRGVAASLLGRPDLDAVSLALKVRGDIGRGAGELTVAAGDAVTVTGKGEWRRTDGVTRATLGVVGNATGLPDGDLARLLRTPVSLNASATFDAANLVLDKAVLDAAPGRIEVSARYRTADDALEASATITSEETGALAPLTGGTGWHGLQATINGAITGLLSTPQGALQARLTASEVTVAGAPLPPLRDLETNARLAVKPGGQLTLEAFETTSSFATLSAVGNLRTGERSGEAKATLVVADLAPLSDHLGAPLSGRATLEVAVGASARGITATWQGRLLELNAGGVPAGLLQPEVHLSGVASLQTDGSWRVRAARVAAETATLTVDGRGKGAAGDMTLALALPDLARFGVAPGGTATVTSRVTTERSGAARLRLDVTGEVAGQPLSLVGDMVRDADGSAAVPLLRGRWASAALDVTNFAARDGTASGRARLTITDLGDIGRLGGADLGGRLEFDVATEPQAADDKLAGRLAVHGLRGVGDIHAVTATIGGEFDNAKLSLQANGARNSAKLRANLRTDDSGLQLALTQLDARHEDLPLMLTAPLQGHIAGERFVIDRAGSFRVAGATLTVSGTIDPAASDIAVDVAAFPLSTLKTFAPGLDLDGTLQAKARLRGALGNPRIEANYAASGVRIRRPGAAFLPPMALNGTASLAGQQATFDARLAGGSASALALKGSATLPRGRQALGLSARLTGAADLALLAPFTGTRVRNLAGRIQPDLEIRIAGDDVTGNGRLVVSGAALSLPDAGLRLERGEATMALRGDTVQVERLRVQTTGGGEITATGTARLDPAKGLAVALQLAMRKALVANRADLITTVSGTLGLNGSMTDGFDVAGPITVDRSEINIGQSASADYPTIEVREINKPGVPNTPPPESRKGAPPPKPATGPSVRLAITIDAPRAVFVRGRGLDAEVGGKLAVGGIASQPSVTGGLTLRRGEFNLAGRRLAFSRGTVTLVRLDSIEPMLDFVATTNANDTTINVLITGTSRAPKIALTSSPALPQDELMANLLFGRATTSLSPFEMIQVAQAVAELTGVSRGPGAVGRLRQGLGFDRLSIDSTGQGVGSTTVEGGRYVAPGVYVGAKQGASGGSSRGVVEIEVLRRTKIEADMGADSKGRIGVKMEWDY